MPLPSPGELINKRTIMIPDEAPAAQHYEASDIPPSFYCPLTLQVMYDPVMDTCGYSYERVAIEGWLNLYKSSPKAPERPVDMRSLIPNKAMKEVIHGVMGTKWVETKRQEMPSGSAEEFVSNARRHRLTRHACQYRRTIDCYLEDMSNIINVELLLSEDGTCAFEYESLNFRVEVSEHCSYFSLSCQSLLVEELTDDLRDRILRLDHFQTRGACVSLDENSNSLQLCYIRIISEVSSSKFGRILEDFLDTAVYLKKRLATPQMLDPSKSINDDDSKRKAEDNHMHKEGKSKAGKASANYLGIQG